MPNRGHQNIKKLVHGDHVLRDITGKVAATRSEYVRLVWKYIKENKLQDPTDGRFIRPDQRLSKLMGTQGEKVNAFKMLHHIEAHLKKA